MKKRIVSFLKKGSGEVIGFVCVMPALVILIIMVITAIRMSVVRENLEYAAYAAARAAVICEDGKTAEAKAKLAAKLSMATANAIYTDLKVKLDYGEWKKGNTLSCKVSAKIGDSDLFISGTKSSKVYMVIERPNDDGIIDYDG